MWSGIHCASIHDGQRFCDGFDLSQDRVGCSDNGVAVRQIRRSLQLKRQADRMKPLRGPRKTRKARTSQK